MHSVFGEFIYISGGWMLLCKESLVMAENSPHITIQCGQSPHNYTVKIVPT